MLSLVKPPISAAQFDAQKHTFERRFNGHLKIFRLVNTIPMNTLRIKTAFATLLSQHIRTGSSVSRILKRGGGGGGGRNFRKFEKKKEQSKKLFFPKLVRFSAQNKVKSKKKKKRKKVFIEIEDH